MNIKPILLLTVFYYLFSIIGIKKVFSQVTIEGELKQWDKITLKLVGPTVSEVSTTFLDNRMDVIFTHVTSGDSFTVPGFFDADGDAANSHATTGNIWKAYLRPHKIGDWTYEIKFYQDNDVAIANTPTGLVGTYSVSGSVGNITANDKTLPDLKAKGRLQYVDKHHLQFQGDGSYFLKFGPDSPENLLSYYEFDNTSGNNTNGKADGIVHEFTAHSGDYQVGDPTWDGGKGKNIIGALNYLSSEGCKTISMSLFGGDDERVFPWVEDYTFSDTDVKVFDVSKLAQWEVVFDHAESKGLFLHFKLAEAENRTDLDIEDFYLYYREMIARFGHHLALNWNIAEEYNFKKATLTTSLLDRLTSSLQFFKDTDPWNMPRVVHNYPNYDIGLFEPFLGGDLLTGVSQQIEQDKVFTEIKEWVDKSSDASFPWIVSVDEIGPANKGVYTTSSGTDINEDMIELYLMASIMAGGAGTEYYAGGEDQSLEDFRELDDLFNWSRHAVVDFFDGQNVPFWEMSNDDALISGTGNRCLMKDGEVYVLYLPEGGTADLDLGSVTGEFTIDWFSIRDGGSLISGGANLMGGSTQSIGSSPTATEDWLVLVQNIQNKNNEIPSVTFTQPLNGDVFEEGTNLEVTATITDNDGSIENAKLYVNTLLVGEDNDSPYEWIGINVNSRDSLLLDLSVGTYSLRIEARDNLGDIATESISIEVIESESDVTPMPSDSSSTVITSLPEILLENVSIYPNPLQNELHITFPASTSITKIQLVDLSGKVLLNKLSEAGTSATLFNLEDVGVGQYFIHIENTDMKEVFKVIKVE